MLDFIRQKAVLLILAAIPVGVIVSILFQWVKKQRAWVDNLPPSLKNGVIFVIGAILAAVSSFTGVEVACQAGENCLALLDEPTLTALVKAVLTFTAAKLTHLIVKGKR